MAHPYWPFFDLTLRTRRLVLRPPNDDDLVALAATAARGIHPPGEMPFAIPWSAVPSPELELSALQFHWRTRSEWSVSNWSLPFVTLFEGSVVGSQSVDGVGFAVRRVVTTGSWLGQRFQGQRLGTEMRAAVLHLAFLGLGAEMATSAAWHDNAPSIAISRRLGYVEDGWDQLDRQGQSTKQVRFRLDRKSWEVARTVDVDIEGLDACLPMFGI